MKDLGKKFQLNNPLFIFVRSMHLSILYHKKLSLYMLVVGRKRLVITKTRIPYNPERSILTMRMTGQRFGKENE